MGLVLGIEGARCCGQSLGQEAHKAVISERGMLSLRAVLSAVTSSSAAGLSSGVCCDTSVAMSFGNAPFPSAASSRIESLPWSMIASSSDAPPMHSPPMKICTRLQLLNGVRTLNRHPKYAKAACSTLGRHYKAIITLSQLQCLKWRPTPARTSFNG